MMNPTITLHFIFFFFISTVQVGWSSVLEIIYLSFCPFQVVHHPSDVPSILSVHCPQHSLCCSDLHQSLHWNQRQHCHLRPGAVC